MMTPAIASRVRALPRHKQLQLIIMLCNRLKRTPDAKIAAHLRWVFRFVKMLVTTYLVRMNATMKAAHEANGLVVVLTDHPTPKHLPQCGVWVGFATSHNGILHCPAQSYVFVEGNRIGMINTTSKLSMHGSCNASIATEEAQLLLHLSQSRA